MRRHPADPDSISGTILYAPNSRLSAPVNLPVLPPLLPDVPLILIVEDNKVNQRLVRDIIRVQGWNSIETETVGDARQILRMLRVRGEMPAAILLDIRLPDESGLVLARELKADRHWKSVPIIAVTALAMNNDEGRILDAGCDAYIAKPISVSELTETVQNYVSSSTLA